MNQAAYGAKFQQIIDRRKKHKAIRYALYCIVIILVLVSIESTIIKDTDWDRIGSIGSIFKALARFLPPDFSLFTQLVKPTIETFMIACLGTMLALILAIPVAWFAALNITPYKPITYPIGRTIMTLSRSVHEIVWGLIFVSAVGPRT